MIGSSVAVGTLLGILVLLERRHRERIRGTRIIPSSSTPGSTTAFGISSGGLKFRAEAVGLAVLSTLAFLLAAGLAGYCAQAEPNDEETLMLAIMVVVLTGLGGWSIWSLRNSLAERRLWLTIRGQELILRDGILSIGNVLLEGTERERLRRQGRAMADVQLSSVHSFEVWPGRQGRRQSSPPYFVIKMIDGHTTYHVRRWFDGQEKVILEAIQAYLTKPIVMRDDFG